MGSSQALFTAIDAGTLTGFPQSYEVKEFLPLGQGAVFGLIVAGSLFSLIIGGMAAVRILRLPYSDSRVFLFAIGAEAVAMMLGTLGLLFDPHRTVFEAVFLSASAFGNCGLVLDHYPPWTHWQTPVVLLPLMTLGGLGLPVIMELYDFFSHRRRLSIHSRVVLYMAAWLFIGGTILLTVLRWTGRDTWRFTLTTSAVLGVNARTTGIPWLWLYHAPLAVFCTLLALMSIGGASAGTAGGIKTNTLVEIVRQVMRIFSGKKASASLWAGLAWMAIFFAMVGGTYGFLLHNGTDLDPHESVLKAFSAVSNCGMVAQVVPKKSFGQFYTLSAGMLAGRFCSLAIIWWVADRVRDADVAIG